MEIQIDRGSGLLCQGPHLVDELLLNRKVVKLMPSKTQGFGVSVRMRWQNVISIIALSDCKLDFAVRFYVWTQLVCASGHRT